MLLVMDQSIVIKRQFVLALLCCLELLFCYKKRLNYFEKKCDSDDAKVALLWKRLFSANMFLQSRRCKKDDYWR